MNARLHCIKMPLFELNGEGSVQRAPDGVMRAADKVLTTKDEVVRVTTALDEISLGFVWKSPTLAVLCAPFGQSKSSRPPKT